jgi:hypothetical protein
MTLEFVDLERVPGYAGTLQSSRHPGLADRFHFWRGASGHRYAFTRFPLNRAPTYENSVSLFVRRRGMEISVLAASGAPGAPVVPLGADEIHVHLVQGGMEKLEESLRDLLALVVPRAAPCPIALRAA